MNRENQSNRVPGESRKDPRVCAIEIDREYSLRDAAQLLAVPEEALRRAVVLEELPASPVSDDRHYLISGGALLQHLRTLRPDQHFAAGGREYSVPAAVAILLLLPALAVLIFLAMEMGIYSDVRGPALPSPGGGIELSSPGR